MMCMEVWGFIGRDIDMVVVFDVFNELFEKAGQKREGESGTEF